MKVVAWLATAALTLAAACPASAAWRLAQTRHFNVYSAGFPDKLTEFANRLEAFDAVLRDRHHIKDTDEPVRLDIYLVRGPKGLEETWPGAGNSVAGYYSASTSAVFAVAETGLDEGLTGQDVLFHEYVHHFMLANFAYPYASWLVEGYAEYYMSTKISDHEIEIGHANENRGAVLMSLAWIPISELASKRMSEIKNGDPENYYPQSWLLSHYFLSDDGRRKQLDDYMRRVGQGQPSADALSAATGMTLPQLEARLRSYTGGPIMGYRIRLSKPLTFPVRVTDLPASADALLLKRVQLRHTTLDRDDDDDDGGAAGKDNDKEKTEREKARSRRAERRQNLLRDIRAAASRYPGDRFAELTLAEAECRLGDRSVGEATLARYVAAKPDDAEALSLLALSKVEAGRRDKGHRAALFAEARPLLGQAFKLDPDNYRILYAYAEVRQADPGYPDDNTLNALELSHQLAPQVDEISFATAQALRSRGRRDEGRLLMTLLANNPHGGNLAKQAKAILQQWEGAGPASR